MLYFCLYIKAKKCSIYIFFNILTLNIKKLFYRLAYKLIKLKPVFPSKDFSMIKGVFHNQKFFNKQRFFHDQGSFRKANIFP